MKMFEVGRMCVKLAGRDAGKKAVIVEVIDNSKVMIDGEVRRRKCNIYHLEPLGQVIELKKGASHSDIIKEFGKLGLKAMDTKPKQKKTQEKSKVEEKPKAKKVSVKTKK